MQSEIITQVKEALAKTLNLSSAAEIDSNAKLKEEYGLDSMTSLTFLIALEDLIPGFFVNPDTLEPEYLETAKSVAAYIEKELGA
jgi:acyl carrier protein